MKKVTMIFYLIVLTFVSNSIAQTFTKVDTGVVATEMASSTGSCWGDYDNDGLMDLFIASFSLSGTGATNFLYHNEGNGYFTKIESGAIVEQQGSYGW